MNKAVYGVNLLNKFTKGTIFFLDINHKISDETKAEILLTRRLILADISSLQGVPGNKYEQMKKIMKKQVRAYFVEYHYVNLLKNIPLVKTQWPYIVLRE
ncbi:hypothetical protein AAEX28_01950 [Lentisphaerota bacterium WC36G]|nr:hypothetical protein LJT99_04835 [Lentisphaerae bacterium WC36]